MNKIDFTYILKLYKRNVPWYAQQKLSQYISRRAELAQEYKKAQEADDKQALDDIKREGLELKEYIEILSG